MGHQYLNIVVDFPLASRRNKPYFIFIYNHSTSTDDWYVNGKYINFMTSENLKQKFLMMDFICFIPILLVHLLQNKYKT